MNEPLNKGDVMQDSNGTAELNAVNLKAELWDTLQKVKAGEITPASGDVVAAQAREILRCVRAQLSIFSQAGKAVSNELVDFAKPTKD